MPLFYFDRITYIGRDKRPISRSNGTNDQDPIKSNVESAKILYKFGIKI